MLQNECLLRRSVSSYYLFVANLFGSENFLSNFFSRNYGDKPKKLILFKTIPHNPCKYCVVSFFKKSFFGFIRLSCRIYTPK